MGQTKYRNKGGYCLEEFSNSSCGKPWYFLQLKMVHNFPYPLSKFRWKRVFLLNQYQSSSQKRTEGQYFNFTFSKISFFMGHTKQCNKWRWLYYLSKQPREGLENISPEHVKSWTCPNICSSVAGACLQSITC